LGEIGRSTHRGAPGEWRPPIRYSTGYYVLRAGPASLFNPLEQRSNAIEPQPGLGAHEGTQCRARGYSSLCSWSMTQVQPGAGVSRRSYGAQYRLYRRAFILRSGHRWNQNGQRRPQSYSILIGCLCFGSGVARSPLFLPSGARALFVKANNDC
jgi:hypothetical protein